MTSKNFAGLLVSVLIVIVFIGQRESDSIPSPAESAVVSGAAQNLATGDKLSKATSKAITGPVKKELIEVGYKLIDESGARAYESVREYEQVDPVSGGILVAMTRLSVFEAKVGLVVLTSVLVIGGIGTVAFRVIRNIQRYV